MADVSFIAILLRLVSNLKIKFIDKNFLKIYFNRLHDSNFYRCSFKKFRTFKEIMKPF